MSFTPLELRLLRTSLPALRCDALATSANTALCGNANPNYWRFAGRKNADGALHRAAGPALLAACAALPVVGRGPTRVRPGCAVVTPGSFGALRTDLVVHAVAPDGAASAPWSLAAVNSVPGQKEADARLLDTFEAALQAVDAAGARSLGMPAIGCGVLGWQPARAAEVALQAFAAAARKPSSLERIDLALPDEATLAVFSRCAKVALGPPRTCGSDDLGGGLAAVFYLPGPER